jgi:hypothetical protein
MELYIFRSNNLTNYMSGYRGKKWAISKVQAEMPGAATKARATTLQKTVQTNAEDLSSPVTPFGKSTR